MASVHTVLVSLIILHTVVGYAVPFWKCKSERYQTTELCQVLAKMKLPTNESHMQYFQDVQRRNSEISSALNNLYGNYGRGFPGKRNPELSSALLHYINSNREDKLYK
ncbi:unnamed protein product [Callosobruchus maculatus]|uniref:Uncharacterized protein n=1 Tax=Callosobruchus maculatus TaxID=64391 RepID=A0A653BMQ8_CALMS|nr:unnamed protein product [Callosobruchus maculatus]